MLVEEESNKTHTPRPKSVQEVGCMDSRVHGESKASPNGLKSCHHLEFAGRRKGHMVKQRRMGVVIHRSFAWHSRVGEARSKRLERDSWRCVSQVNVLSFVGEIVYHCCC